MVINRRKKNSRTKGNMTHGWGSKKKRRGSGHRGGKGNAGSGKRADSNKPSNWKNKKYMGKHGFVYHGQKVKVNPITVSTVEQKAVKWIKDKKAKEEKGQISVDLEPLGYNKLLGSGKISQKLLITVSAASERAIKAVEDAGGKVTVKNVNLETDTKQSS
ncbi:uL15m family ribosomal protein [Nanoarchaeota archaeon]